MEEQLVHGSQTAEDGIAAQHIQGNGGTRSVEAPRENVKRPVRLQDLFELGLIVTGLFAMLKFLPHYVLGADAQLRFREISELLEYGKVPDMKYSIVGPSFSIPFWLLGRVYQTPIWWCERYNLFVFAVGLLLFYLLLRTRIDRSLLHKFLLLLITASMFGNHITNYYTEVFTSICVGVGILAITLGPALAGWCAVVLGVVNAPATMLGLCCMVLKHVLDNRRLRYVLASIAAVLLICAEAWLRRGSPLNGGYGGEAGFQVSWIGLLSVLFSFGKGLIFFAPGLLLPIRSTILAMKSGIKLQMYRTYMLWLCFLVGMILVYSSWWAWYGGWFWGPRFFLFASIPASFALAVRLHYRDTSLSINLLAAIVFFLSVWVGIDGAVFDLRSLEGVCSRMMDGCLYQPQLSVLWRPFLVHVQISPLEALYAAYCVIVAAYLVLPLLGTIVQQTLEVAKNYGRIYLKGKAWHI